MLKGNFSLTPAYSHCYFKVYLKLPSVCVESLILRGRLPNHCAIWNSCTDGDAGRFIETPFITFDCFLVWKKMSSVYILFPLDFNLMYPPF